jgi:hypothetical protein
VANLRLDTEDGLFASGVQNHRPRRPGENRLFAASARPPRLPAPPPQAGALTEAQIATGATGRAGRKVGTALPSCRQRLVMPPVRNQMSTTKVGAHSIDARCWRA